MLQDGDAEACPDDWCDVGVAIGGFQEVGEFCGTVVFEGLGDVSDLAVYIGAVDFGEDFSRFASAAFADEVAGRFRKFQGGKGVEERRDDFDPEHHLPGFESGDEGVVGGACNPHDDVVGEEGDEDADDDGELLHGTQAPAEVAGGGFCDVDGGDDACNTHADAAYDTPDNEIGDAVGEPGTDGAEEEQDGGCQHTADAAETVGEAACEVGADGGADEGEGDGPGEVEVGCVEVDFYCSVCAVDDGGIKAKQKAANGRGDGDEGDVPDVGRFVLCHRKTSLASMRCIN